MGFFLLLFGRPTINTPPAPRPPLASPRPPPAGFVLLTSHKNKYRARLTFAALYIKLYCIIYVLRAALNKALIGKLVYSRTAPAAVAPPAPSTEFLGRSGRYTGAHPAAICAK